VVLVIALVVGIAIAAGRTLGNNSRPPTAINGGDDNGSLLTSSASPGADDDGVQTPAPTLSATPSDLKTQVDRFMTAWLNRTATPDAWHAAIAKLSTQRLSTSLIGVDPLSVPATRVISPPTFPILTATFSQAAIEVDSGTVTLTLLNQDGTWLVDGVDWQRS
jgi:hypothetical protein